MSTDVIQELQRRQKALSSLADFRSFMEPSGHVDFQFSHEEHHRIMAHAFEMVMNGSIKRLIIMLPPASAKSTLLIQFCLWWLSKNPHDHILRVSATQTLSERFARRLRSATQEKEFKLLTGAELSSTEQSVSSFATTKGGAITSAGVGSSIIGLRSSINIVDDYISSWEQAHSQSQREQMLNWFHSELRSRLVPNAPEIIVSTRWHHSDLIGELLRSEEADTWHVIRIPMECDDPENDPLNRNLGERLWPEWFTDQMVEEAKRDPERFSGMFQQKPLNTEGDFLRLDDFEIVDEIPHLQLYAALDLALTERQNADATVIGIGGIGENGDLYLVDMIVDRVSPEKTLERISNLHDQYHFAEVMVEDSPAEKVFRDLAHKFFRQQGKPIPLMPMPTRGRDKMARAQAFRGLAKMGSVKLLRGSWNAEFIREVSEFPFGKHDDQVDVAALFGQRAAKMVHTAAPKSYKAPEIQTALIENDAGLHTRATMDDMWADHERIDDLKVIRI
jgi:predicted phage terminase large subunit-like protein